MTTPKLSIIIPTWNTAGVTAKCIDTINANLDTKLVYEIIISDNGSTDDTQQKISAKKNVIYFNNGSNLGFSKANNLAVKKSTGDYLLFLNSDMELVDDQLISMLNYLMANRLIGCIGPKFLNTDLSPQASVFPPQTPINAIKEYWLNQKNAYSKYIPLDSDPTPVWSISGGAILISKKLFNKIGGWSEKYFMFYEDLDFCDQVRKHGFQIYYFPGCKVIHRHGASGKNLAPDANQWRRLIPSSIKYHGYLSHQILFVILWSSQKFKKLFIK